MNGETEVFDEVVLACHAPRALEMIEAPAAAEREVLGALRYQPNQVTLHTDPGLMPHRKGTGPRGTSGRPTARRSTAMVTPTLVLAPSSIEWWVRLAQLERRHRPFLDHRDQGLRPPRILTWRPDVCHSRGV